MSDRRVVAFHFFLQGLCAASWMAQIPSLQVARHLNHAQLGSLLLTLNLATVVGIPLAGALLARTPLRWAMWVGALVHATALFALSSAQGTLQLCASLLVFGLANSWVQVAVNQRALDVQAHFGRPQMALFHGCWSVAAALAALLAHASGRLGVAAADHLRTLAVMVAAGALVAARARPTTLPASRASAKDASGPVAGQAWRRPPQQLAVLGAVTAVAMALEAIAFDWGAVRYRQALGEEDRLASLGCAAVMLGMTGGRLVADRLAHRLRSSTVLEFLAALVGCGLFATAAFSSPHAVLLGLGLQGLGLSAMVPLLLGHCDALIGVATARALAWASTIGALGALAGPTAFGWSAQIVGLRVALGVSALGALVVAAVGGPLLRALRQQRGPSDAVGLYRDSTAR